MSKSNRIGEPCWYQVFGGVWRRGILRAWSVDEYDQGKAGIFQVPVAVVEDREHKNCLSLYVERISFAVDPPNTKQKQCPP